MKYLLDLNIKEVIDGLVAVYLLPSHDDKSYFSKLYFSLKSKIGFSLENSLKFLMEMGEEYDLKFTFFTVGRLAKKYPDMVKYILDHKHEIASHSYKHTLPLRLVDDVFIKEITESKKLLENMGAEIKGFRSPFLLMKESQYELLAKSGYEYSSSQLWDHNPVMHQTKNGDIMEMPINFEDLRYIEYADDYVKLAEIIRENLTPKKVLLFHPIFIASPKYRKVWELAFKENKIKSVGLKDLDNKSCAITIDLGIGKWKL